MEECWESKSNWCTGESTKDGEELVNLVSKQNSKSNCKSDGQSTCEILKHLTFTTLLHSRVEIVLKDDMSWIKLKWVTKHQV